MISSRLEIEEVRLWIAWRVSRSNVHCPRFNVSSIGRSLGFAEMQPDVGRKLRRIVSYLSCVIMMIIVRSMCQLLHVASREDRESVLDARFILFQESPEARVGETRHEARRICFEMCTVWNLGWENTAT